MNKLSQDISITRRGDTYHFSVVSLAKRPRDKRARQVGHFTLKFEGLAAALKGAKDLLESCPVRDWMLNLPSRYEGCDMHETSYKSFDDLQAALQRDADRRKKVA